jgi:hypothetical protein
MHKYAFINTVNSLLSGMYGEWGTPVIQICQLHKKSPYRYQVESQNNIFSLQFLHGSLLGDTADSWVKDLECAHKFN